MSDMPTLKYGSSGPEVAHLVKLLTKHGCAPNPRVTSTSPRFGRAVENMVLYFQMTHQGQNDKWLAVDGVAGSGTWWALEHAHGEAQRSFLQAGIPKGITEKRRDILDIALRQHGVREKPTGSNRGKDVDKFQPHLDGVKPSEKGRPWCAYFVSWVVKEAYGTHLLGRPVAAVWIAYKRAKEHNRWLPVKGNVPTPGDAFVMLKDGFEEKQCSGHIGFVLQVAKDGKSINTIEGNCGDRVKIGKRWLDEPRLRGFINIVGDRPEFSRGSLRGAKNVGSSRTR